MKKSVSTVYGVLLVIGFILMALSFAFTGKKNTSFAEDFRRIELQPDRVVEVSQGALFRLQPDAVGVFGTDIF